MDYKATARNLRELAALAAEALEEDTLEYLEGGADDRRTVLANESRFARFALRVRRLVDVSRVDTTVEVLGERWPAPLALAPVGLQQMFHPEGELPAVRAAAARGLRAIVSTVSSRSIEEIAEHAPGCWFQLYPTSDRGVAAELLARAEAAGCPVVALTVDVPVIGNRERGTDTLNKMLMQGKLTLGNFPKLDGSLRLEDPSLDWSIVEWLHEHTSMRVVLKGIVTAEDARVAVDLGVDGIVVSNHGGRQEESDRASIESLPEVVDAVAGRAPVLFDGGVRRGTDCFKALALGALAVCVGRPYVWGVVVDGEDGAGYALDLLIEELVRTMQLAGTSSLAAIDSSHVTRNGEAGC